jgi:formate/nitrite transporter FocA (FNT family)
MMILVAGGTPMLAEAVPGLHQLMGAAIFPVGLALITFSGTEMITGNFASHFLPFLTNPDRE